MTLSADFLSKIRSYDTDAFRRLETALGEEPLISVRLNPAKPAPACIDAGERVAWCAEGVYLDARPQFTLMPELHQGRLYVQEASSMFISHVIRELTQPDTPVAYLDACAAPGGKTTAAIAALPARSVVVANEYVAERADILRENLAKWGYPYCRVMRGEVSRMARGGAQFQIVAADVPCSGEGMMRKDIRAVEQWSQRLVEQCAERQRSIVTDLWPALMPGGYMIYSTCTYSREENEEVLQYIIEELGAEPVTIPVDAAWNIQPGIDTPYPCYRFVPGTTRGEGLFMAVVRKAGADTQGRPPKMKRAKPDCPEAPKQIAAMCRDWLSIDSRILADERGRVWAQPDTEHLPWLQPWLRPMIHVADIKGNAALPSAELALNGILRPGVLPVCELGYDDALQYLRGNALALPGDTPRGAVVVQYGGVALGMVKNLGNRANNLHPAPWRILK